MSIRVNHLTFSYDRATEKGITSIVRDLSCIFTGPQVAVILGPSGSGKTTFLSLLSGLLSPTSTTSSIEIKGNPPDIALSKRTLAYLPQDFQPAPWRTASKNVEFVLKLAHPDEDNPRETADALLKDLQLSELGHRYPREMSGGQVRRLALAMCLAVRPKCLLLDEPFTGLDVHTKYELCDFIKSLLNGSPPSGRAFGIVSHLDIILLVSHDLDDALFLADSVHALSENRPTQMLSELTGPDWQRFREKRRGLCTERVPTLPEYAPARLELQTSYVKAIRL